jgi:hypothetical protein
MLLVVALVGGLLFALFQDQELESQTVEDFEGEDVRVEEVTADNGSVELSLISYSSEDIESAEVCLNNDDVDKICSKEFSLTRLGNRVVGLNGFNESDESYTYDISVSYETTGGISDTVEGSVSLGLKPEVKDDSSEENPSEKVSLSVRNVGDNVSSVVSPGDSVEIYAEFNSTGSSLDSGWLATNESGVWENKTDNYLNDLSGGGEWVWNNFTWSNSSVSDTNVSWKLYANNSDGKVENSSKKTFEVGSGVSAPSVEVLEPVGVNSSNATLRGNLTDLGGASTVDVSFNVTSNSSIGVKDAGTVSSVGVFKYNLTSLEVATEYNYTAIAENDADSVESSRNNFQTETLIIDDFEDASNSEYTRMDSTGGSFSIGSSKVKSGVYSGVYDEPDSSSRVRVQSKSGLSYYPKRGNKFRYYIYLDSDNILHNFVWAFDSVGSYAPTNGYSVYIADGDGNQVILQDRSGPTNLDAVNLDPPKDVWIEVLVDYRESIEVNLTNTETGSQIANLEASDSSYDSGRIGWAWNGDSGVGGSTKAYVDDLEVLRK